VIGAVKDPLSEESRNPNVIFNRIFLVEGRISIAYG
jgi:hypothetical protein